MAPERSRGASLLARFGARWRILFAPPSHSLAETDETGGEAAFVIEPLFWPMY